MIAENPHLMRGEARKLLAWRAIEDEADELKLDEAQRRQLSETSRKQNAT
jgi:hypothetical protein